MSPIDYSNCNPPPFLANRNSVRFPDPVDFFP